MEQSGTIDSLGKSNDCSSREEKPKDIDTGVDGNQQSRDGSQYFEVLEDLTKNLKIYGKENFRVILGSYLSPLQKQCGRYKDTGSVNHLFTFTVPTHNKSHILDWVITENEEIIKDLQVGDNCVSDHFVVTFQLDVQKPPPKKRTVVTRSKDIDHAKLSIDLSSKEQEIPIDSACYKVEAFNSIMTNILDKYAPLKTRTVTDKPAAPWMTATTKEAKAERRRAERTWRASKLTVHRDIFKQCNSKIKNLI
ncbi:reverse transcriptase-like protein [Elysia marginata]|uniref:Reverse transcriptase-like protein n=1 Tax=Elysia marginata TaxID=1093978 RepID=A0AAV4FV84_9GAST|nr:reverse transcriptase-like protein [Elysia marginata]